MSLFTPAVVVILALAALCALLAFRLRSLFIKYPLLLVATALLVLAIWLGASDAWAFRDGFPLPAPGYAWSETHGLAAAKAFLLGFWVSLLGAVAVAALIVASWRHPASPGTAQHSQH
ncbi:MAG TPA: hypothetical protein VNN25_26785 [Thermoanaerobaculia bacterium]|nr:hypothetical protein [Thermoanaerobaculia bacterium]